MPVAAMTAEIRKFLSSVITERVLSDTEDFFELGYVNSLMALELVTYVERRFGIEVEAEDLDLDNFRTISRIAEFVRRKWAATGSAGRPDDGRAA